MDEWKERDGIDLVLSCKLMNIIMKSPLRM